MKVTMETNQKERNSNMMNAVTKEKARDHE
jgi:hypothetical protein